MAAHQKIFGAAIISIGCLTVHASELQCFADDKSVLFSLNIEKGVLSKGPQFQIVRVSSSADQWSFAGLAWMCVPPNTPTTRCLTGKLDFKAIVTKANGLLFLDNLRQSFGICKFSTKTIN